MKISYNWLQTYFEEKLPAPRELAELFTMYAFEVESVDEVGLSGDGARRDHIFDIKVLPNRAHDCLSHRGVAREIGTLLGRKINDAPRAVATDFKSTAVSVDIADTALCSRYSAAFIADVKVGPSPAWLRERLEALGQKSINNIVDATNYVMFALGQPLHAFDVGKLIERESRYSILVRTSKAGESVEALDGKTYTLPEHTLVITDKHCKDNKILGIAGIKGGTAAQIDENTTSILLESAHFDPVHVRTTAKVLGLRTDASVRFENGITPEFTLDALQDVAELIIELAGGTVDALVDVRTPQKPQTTIELTFSDIEHVLGFSIPHKKILDILSCLGCRVEHREIEKTSGDATLSVTVPYERLDLSIKEDIIEEIGRVYGFFNVPPIEPKNSVGLVEQTPYNKTVACTDYIRMILARHGFNEVYTYSFRKTGERELQNPIASDKAFLRSNLADGLTDSMALNIYNAPLLQIRDVVKIYEIGNVFSKGGEHVSCAIALAPLKFHKKSQEEARTAVARLIEDIESTMGTSFNMKELHHKEGVYVWEINLTDVLQTLPEPSAPQTGILIGNNSKYKKISPYPFMLRDIAVFVPVGVDSHDVYSVIADNASDLLVSSSLFDIFTKTLEDGTSKTSYAYSLVFQSNERTLSDDEINEVMKRVTDALNTQAGWQVR